MWSYRCPVSANCGIRWSLRAEPTYCGGSRLNNSSSSFAVGVPCTASCISCANVRITSSNSYSRPSVAYSSTPASTRASLASPRSDISCLKRRSSSMDSGSVGCHDMKRGWDFSLPLTIALRASRPLGCVNASALFARLDLNLARPALLGDRNLNVQHTIAKLAVGLIEL